MGCNIIIQSKSYLMITAEGGIEALTAKAINTNQDIFVQCSQKVFEFVFSPSIYKYGKKKIVV
jgi:hypothetical protein